MSQLYDGSGNIKNWTQFKNDYDLKDNFHLKWVQLNSIPRDWKPIIKKNISLDLLVLDYHLIYRKRSVNVEKRFL